MKYLYILIGLIILNVYTLDASRATRESDSLFLVSLYNATGGENWLNKTNWLSDKPVWLWQWIETRDIIEGNDTTVVVKSLILQSNGLSGQLPEIKLPYLESLVLSNNQISGNFPEIDLPELVVLNVARNKFDGDFPNIFAPKLQYLDLSNNLFSGAIPSINYEFLIVLDLSDNKFSGNFPQLIAPFLRDLDISNNLLSGQLPDFSFEDLETLDLSSNKFTGNLPLLQLPMLLILDLSDNLISGPLPELFLEEIYNIDLSGNNLTGTLPLIKFEWLRYLNLSNNKLTGSIDSIAGARIIEIDLSHNLLSGDKHNIDAPYAVIIRINDNKLTGLPLSKSLIGINNMYVENNKLTFDDLEQYYDLTYFSYSPQDTVLPIEVRLFDAIPKLVMKTGGSTNKYQWFYNDNLIEENELPVLNIENEGKYYCIITNELLPQLTLYSDTVEVNWNSIKEQSVSEVKISIIRNNLLLENVPLESEIELFDVNGIQIYKSSEPKTTNLQNIDMNVFSSGVYILNLKSANSAYLNIIRFVKE